MLIKEWINNYFVILLFFIIISFGPVKIILVETTFNNVTDEEFQNFNQLTKTFGGDKADYAYDLLQTLDGGFILAGETHSYGLGPSDMWLIKTDSRGNIQWNKTYGGLSYEAAYSVVQTLDGGFILAGYTNSFHGRLDTDVWLVKVDSSGSLEWNRTYGGFGEDICTELTLTNDGDLVLAGITSSFGSSGADIWILKTDISGVLKWNKSYGLEEGGKKGGEEGVNDIIQTLDGGFALAGYRMVTFRKNPVAFTSIHLKIDESGVLEWMKYYGDPINGNLDDIMTQLNCIIQTDDGGFALSGSYGSKMLLIKTNNNGLMQWNHTFETEVAYQADNLIQVPDGGFVFAGSTDPAGIGKSLIFVSKTGNDGIQQWYETVPMEFSTLVEQLILTNDGKFVVCGSILTSNYLSDMFLLIIEEEEVNSNIDELIFKIGLLSVLILAIGILFVLQKTDY